MTGIEKKLLISDLCARLPYGVKVECNNKLYRFVGIQSFNIITLVNDDVNNAFTTAGIKYIKPYLTPISKMTEEQRLELETITGETIGFDAYALHDFTGYSEISLSRTMEIIQWCYENHIDINGLIPMGLANDATNLNIY